MILGFFLEIIDLSILTDNAASLLGLWANEKYPHVVENLRLLVGQQFRAERLNGVLRPESLKLKIRI